MYFLDCEASSLHETSYPIEIAWVDEAGQGESYLIRPQPAWTDWSAKAESIHHISLAMLHRDGKPAAVVARHAVSVLSSKIIVSDNPTWDQNWLAILLGTIRHPALHLVHFDSIMRHQIQRLNALNTFEPQSAAWHRESRRLLDLGQTIVGYAEMTTTSRVRHRALNDAETLWRCWRTVKEKIDSVS